MKTHLIDLTYTAPREQYTFQSEGRLWRWLGTLLVVMGCTLSVAQAQVSGKVFQDFNANGAQGTASPNLEPGYGGITVKAYDASGTQVATATTAADGTYTLTGVTGAVRVEFTGFPSYYYSGPKGTQNNTSVQFVTAPATNVNFGINYPVNYCQSNPNLATPCYVNGAASGTGDVLVSWPYSNSGTTGTVNHLATQTQIGSTYGLTYDRTGKQLYSSSWLKRHVGLPDLNNDSKGDLGNIYVTNTTTNATSLWLDLTTLGIDFGSIANDAGRGLGVLTAPSNDPTSFAMVGKAGIGDIDLSDDGKTLYLTNLFDKKLYAIDVATKTVISSWIVPQTCSNNDVVNMGLKYYQGNVYVGQVCTAETSQNTADLKATVYKFDGTSFTSVLSFPVNYTRGDAVYGPDAVCSSGSQWHAWATPPFQDCTPRGFGLIVYTQPILSDIEFDPVDGRMIVGLRDRYGDQTGRNNYATTGTAVYESVIGGEILGAIPDGAGGYILESAGKLGSLTGSTNGKGPGGGEFYNGENWTNGVGGHQETSMGGLAILPGRNEIALTAIDPVQSVSGGVIFLNETNGTRSNQFELFKSSGAETFGKANGLGDLELLCDPAPIEIGNRVWKDTDNDGIQDPDEPALAGVTVQLTDASGTLIATAITDANGNYIFSSAVGTSTTSTKYGLNLMPTTNYTLKVSSLGTDASVTGLTLTSVTIAPGETTSTNTGATLNNNDAFVSGGLPTINLKTGETGANNHTYDFGFTSVSSVFDLALRKTLAAGQAASVNPGSTVKFTITIYNQGNVDATAIQVSDYIPTGLTLNDANWSVSGGIATLNTPIGSLAAGASTTRDITFTVNAGFTGTAINKAEISSAIGGTDLDSTPDQNMSNDAGGKENSGSDDAVNGNGTGTPGGTDPATDEDDEDPAVITVTPAPIFDLALRKTLAAGQAASVNPGSTVKFTITIYNQGNVDATAIQVSDYIPTGLTLNDANWSVSGGIATLNTPIGSLAAGASTTRDITFTVNAGFTGTAINKAEISSAIGGTDLDSTPDQNMSNDAGGKENSGSDDAVNGNGTGTPGGTDPATDEDDEDPAVITVTPAPIFDLALRKTLAAGQAASVNPGSTVKFTITIYNQGNVDATAIQVSDYIPTGLTLNDANWSVSGGIATLNTPIGSLAAGASTTRDITFTVNAGVTGSLTNTAEISSATGGTDVDSSPDNNPNNDGTPKNDVINEDGQNGNDQDDSDPEVINILCIKPILTTGNIVCSGTTYSVVYYSSVSNVTASAGTVSNGMITGIPVGTNVTITATQSAGCVTSLSIEGPASCQTNPNCTLPMLIVGQPACEGNNTYSVSFYANRGTVTVSAGTISGNSVINIPISQDLTIRATDGTCVSTNIVPKPVNCSDPCENPSLSVSGPVCDGSSSYHLNYVLSPGATLMSSHGTVSNGQVIGLPTGTNVTLTVKKTGCADKIIVFPAVYCSTEKVDLALKKLINKKQAKVGDEVEYTLKVWNESSTPATGVEVNDTLSAGVEYVSSSATRGSYNPTTHQWVIGNVGANGDTVTLRIRVKVLLGGIWFNKAEISKTNEPDEDSTPGNGTEGEDDIDRVCFTVPMQLCVGEKVQASVPAQYTNVKWFKNGGTTPISTGNTVLLSEVGTYTYTSTSNTCPAEGCCPIIIEAGTNCCPVDICIPFTINKKRK